MATYKSNMFKPENPNEIWQDTSKGTLTNLQAHLKMSDLSRDFGHVRAAFLRRGVDLVRAFDDVVSNSSDDRIVALDDGCGTGATIEDFWKTMHTRESLRGRALHVIGVDVNPLPFHMPDHVHERGRIHTEFLINNAESLDIPDNSVNFGYSFALLRYCQNPLRAIEEAHRVLKPNGVMVWGLSTDNDVSFYPSLARIIDKTPGAKQTFTAPRGRDRLGSALVCRKDSESGFEGFPYEVAFTLPRILTNYYDYVAQFTRNRIHRRVNK